MKKRIVTIALVIALLATCFAGSYAYLFDSDSKTNVMTLGSVYIEQHEQERGEGGSLVAFTDGKAVVPAVGTTVWDDNGVNVNGVSYKIFDETKMKNIIDKIVTVENTGKSDAFVRTIIAIEAPDFDPNDLIGINYNIDAGLTWSNPICVTISGVEYVAFVCTYEKALAPTEISAPSLVQLYLDPAATNEDVAAYGETWEVLVLSQAVQADGFENAKTALDTAFGVVDAANLNEWFSN